jgi:hypothetical protein
MFLGGIEPSPSAPEADALSAELQEQNSFHSTQNTLPESSVKRGRSRAIADEKQNDNEIAKAETKIPPRRGRGLFAPLA